MAAPSLVGNGRARNGRYRPMAEINVTPLVDVMLVLLVVFMVAAPLLTVGVPVDLPQTQAPPINEPKEPLVITVNNEGKIFIQDTAIAERRAGAALAGDHRRQPRRARLCAGRQVDRLRPGARSDEPDQRRRLSQGVADRPVAEGRGGARGRTRRALGGNGKALSTAFRSQG